MSIQTHSSAQLILLGAVAFFNGLLSLIAVVVRGQILLPVGLSLWIALASLWALWLLSVVGWFRGVNVEFEEGGDHEQSANHRIRRLLVP